MSSGMHFRDVSATDVRPLAELHRAAVVRGYAHIFPATSEPPNVAELEAAWASLLADAGARVIVAEDAGVVIGSVALVADASVPTGLLLKRLHVDPDLWGQGIGGALHDAALQAVRAQGRTTVNLWVLEDNVRARDMYERRGWELAHPLQTLPNHPSHIVDVLYQKDLVPACESVSTWCQPTPAPASAARSSFLQDLAIEVCELSPHRLRIVVDGYTASGKTSFGHELAAAVRQLGRPTLRASLDDFKKPWRDAQAKGYDRVSGEGYYRNAPDFESAQRLLLEPAGPAGSGQVVLCAHDPLTGVDHRGVSVSAPDNAVLIVDSVFAFRPEYNEYWDYRIWLDVPPEVSLHRGVARDGDREGIAEAEQLHRDRYHASERIYIAEVDPVSLADVVIDNNEFGSPLRRR